MYSYLEDDNCIDKKAKGTNKCVINENLNSKITNRVWRLQRRLQRRDGVISYLYGTGAGRMCKSKLMEYTKKKIEYHD